MSQMLIIDWALKIVTGLILAFWLYRDARSRDFYWPMWTMAPVMILFVSGFAWIIVVILIIAIYLAIRPKGVLLACPHCKKRVHDELAFCPFCRRSVKRECIKCHHTVPWDAVSCPHCRSTALTDS